MMNKILKIFLASIAVLLAVAGAAEAQKVYEVDKSKIVKPLSLNTPGWVIRFSAAKGGLQTEYLVKACAEFAADGLTPQCSESVGVVSESLDPKLREVLNAVLAEHAAKVGLVSE